MIKTGIIGGAGYTAGELIRLLIHHPAITIDFVFSTSNAGNKISDVHQDLLGQTDKFFTDKINADVDVVFLCLGHGNSTTFLRNPDVPGFWPRNGWVSTLIRLIILFSIC